MDALPNGASCCSITSRMLQPQLTVLSLTRLLSEYDTQGSFRYHQLGWVWATYISGLTTNTQLASCLSRPASVMQIRIKVALSSDLYALSHSVQCCYCFFLLLHPHPLCTFQIQFAYSGSCDFLVPSSSHRDRVQMTLQRVPYVYSAVHGLWPV